MMRKKVLGIIILLLLTVTGCDWQVNYDLADQIEFLPESGADQYVMGNALSKTLQSIDFQKYAKQKVYLEVIGGTSFSQNVLYNLAAEKLYQMETVILQRLPLEEQEKGLKEEPGDFELKLNILTCGVHSYDGIIRKHIFGLALVSLEEKNKENTVKTYPGKLQRYQYEPWIFSNYFIAAFLALMVLGLVVILIGCWRKAIDNKR
jgi:hypothetical protein